MTILASEDTVESLSITWNKLDIRSYANITAVNPSSLTATSGLKSGDFFNP